MTDADKLREIAKIVQLKGFQYLSPEEILWFASMLDAVPPETLRALKAGTWKAVPREPTERMVAHGFSIHPCSPGQSKVTDCYNAMLSAAPAKPEG